MNAHEFTFCLLDELDYLVTKAMPHVRDAKLAAANDPTILDVWYDPAFDSVVARTLCESRSGSNVAKLAGFDIARQPADTPSEPHWVGLVLSRQKTAAEPTAWQKVQGALGWNDVLYPPSPLAAMLASGVLGAGLGYGGASLASMFLPKTWDKKKFRRSGLLLGGAMGAAPGALQLSDSLLIGQPVTDGRHLTHFQQDKSAAFGIDASAMIEKIWSDPWVSSQLTSKQKALTTGALNCAQQIAGSPYITNADMARLTAGMGIGYARGLVAGKVLGTLTGMPESTQQTLAQTGMYAGAIKATLPMIFGIR